MTRAVLIYANSQGEELMRTGRYLRCFADDVTFKWIPLHKVSVDDWEKLYGPDFMRDVVTVWEQVESGPPTAHRMALHERLPSRCETVRFPPLSALFLWPFTGNDPLLAADPERYPWPDSLAAILSTESLSDASLFDKYMALATKRMPNLERRLRMDVGRWKATDALADVQAAEWVEQNFRTTQLFHTAGHITAAATSVAAIRDMLRRRGLG